jgi:hypothetical protein
VQEKSQPLIDSILRRAERRRDVRFRLDAEVTVLSPTAGRLPAQALEISESGMSAILPVQLDLQDVVQLAFRLPFGPVEISAVVRHRTAFRHGFEFAKPNTSRNLIRQSCDLLTPCPLEERLET